MKHKNKNIFLFSAIALIVLLIVQWAFDFMDKVTGSKPHGHSIRSTISIEEAKKENVFIVEYKTETRTQPSANGNDSYTIDEIWVERNRNYSRSHPKVVQSDNTLSVQFSGLTERNLHKVRLIGSKTPNYEVFTQTKHPAGNQQLRFLLNTPPDTLFLAVIERNPQDSLAWLTETVIDTLCLIKQ